MNPRSTALWVIDVQQGFINDHSRPVVPSVKHLVESWTAHGAPVVLTRFRNPVGSPYETITGWTALRSADEQALAPEIEPYLSSAAGVIDKTGSSALTPDAMKLLRQAGWSDVVLCGIDTDACVYDTAVAAFQLGYRPWIVTDACASTGGPEYHDAALLLAGRNLGRDQLITSDIALSRIGAAV